MHACMVSYALASRKMECFNKFSTYLAVHHLNPDVPKCTDN